MKITLKLLRFDEIASVDGIELDEHDEEVAGGSMATIFERLSGRLELSSCHPFLVKVERTTVGFLMLREGQALPSWANPDAISLHNFRISRQARGGNWHRSSGTRRGLDRCSSSRKLRLDAERERGKFQRAPTLPPLWF